MISIVLVVLALDGCGSAPPPVAVPTAAVPPRRIVYASDPGPDIASIARVPLYGVPPEGEDVYWELVSMGLPSPPEVELREAELTDAPHETQRSLLVIARDAEGADWALTPFWTPVASVGARHDLSRCSLGGGAYRCEMDHAWPFLARDPANRELVADYFETRGTGSIRDLVRISAWRAASRAFELGHHALAIRWAELSASLGDVPEDVTDLLADARRRLARGPRPAARRESVADLVDLLDEARSAPANDLVHPIVHLGAAALPTLLECLEHDRRLTRAYRERVVDLVGLGPTMARTGWALVRDLCLDATLQILRQVAPIEMPPDPPLGDDARIGVWALYLRHYIATHPVSPAPATP